MALFVLGDTHLSLGGSKPMDVFPGWNGYVERLEANWRKLVKPEDTIVLAGDISWAMRLTDTRKDFEFLQQLPGQKLIMKGNHDYWWTTANKMNAYLKAEGFDTLHILHNNSYSVEGYAICGTRGWLFDVGEPHDEKVMNREIGRLKMSLDAAEPGLEKLVFLHYPPVYTGTSAPEIVATLRAYGIRTCYYGARSRWHALSCPYPDFHLRAWYSHRQSEATSCNFRYIFACGHASNSISAALGMAVAARENGDTDRHVVAVIGDGAM